MTDEPKKTPKPMNHLEQAADAVQAALEAVLELDDDKLTQRQQRAAKKFGRACHDYFSACEDTEEDGAA